MKIRIFGSEEAAAEMAERRDGANSAVAEMLSRSRVALNARETAISERAGRRDEEQFARMARFAGEVVTDLEDTRSDALERITRGVSQIRRWAKIAWCGVAAMGLELIGIFVLVAVS